MDYEDRVRQGINVVFKELIYKLYTWIQNKSYYWKHALMGRDSQKRNQWWECAFHEEKGHRTTNCRAFKTFLDQLIWAGHLKEYVDRKKTKIEEAEVRPNPRVDRDNDKRDDALEEDLLRSQNFKISNFSN